MSLPEVAEIKTEIQSLGLRPIMDSPRRNGGAGPAEGISLFLGDVAATVPTCEWLTRTSPYSLHPNSGGEELRRGKLVVSHVRVLGEARFYQELDSEGRPLRRLALLHGRDCLATTVNQVCAYWQSGRGCKFCGIGLSLSRGETVAEKDPRDLARAARKAMEMDGVKHVTLTTGTPPTADRGISSLARAARAIKEATGLPIHAQALPPDDLIWLQRLAESGVDTLGIHVETFSPPTLKRVCESKFRIGYSRFIEAWKRAVDIFGWGQVSSFIIVGLGENDSEVISGAKLLAELGVYPYVVPFRPIPGTPMEHNYPPAPARMKRIYQEVAAVIAPAGLKAGEVKAGCVRCGACSALPDYELGCD